MYKITWVHSYVFQSWADFRRLYCENQWAENVLKSSKNAKKTLLSEYRALEVYFIVGESIVSSISRTRKSIEIRALIPYGFMAFQFERRVCTVFYVRHT